MFPKLFDAFGLTLYSYPLFLGLAWGLSFRLCEARYPKTLNKSSFILWFIGVFVCSWIGAKLLFVFTQDKWVETELLSQSNFWLGGGLVYLGGMLAGGIFTFIFAKIKKIPLSDFDFSIVPMLYSHSLGRVGCLLAGCCFGSETNLPWAIHLHQANRHPVQIYEAFLLLGLAWLIDKKSRFALPHYLIGYGLLRFVLEFFRGDEIRGELANLSTSQAISLAMTLAGILVLVAAKRLKSREKN